MTLAQAKAGLHLQAKVKSNEYNFGDNWETPVCTDGSTWPACRPACVQQAEDVSAVGFGTTDEGISKVSMKAFAPAVITVSSVAHEGLVCSETGIAVTDLFSVTDTIYHTDHVVMSFRVVLSNGRTFIGSAANLARAVTYATGRATTAQELMAMLAASESAGGAASAITVSGAGATALRVGAGGRAAALLARGGLYGVLVSEVTMVGWEAADIRSSAATACQNGWSLGKFFNETCGMYGHYINPRNWCW
jgi:hypothetical protein